MEPFRFYWNRLNPRAGTNFLIIILVLFILSKFIDFPWYIVGTSVLLTWLVILLGKPDNKILMICLYLVMGYGITWINNYFMSTYWPWFISIFVVTFFGTFLLKYGLQWYMLGWCSILWFYLLPVMRQMGNPQELLSSHLIGSSSVLILILISKIGWGRGINTTINTVVKNQEEPNSMALWWIISYASIVAFVMVFGLIIGYEYLSDPTMISNSAFMIIGFTGGVTIWKAGFERVIGVTLAVIIGFYLGAFLQSEYLGIVIMVVFYFLVLVFIEVNNGAVIFFFILTISYGWGLKDFEVGNALANERVIAEFAGVALAGVAILFLNILAKFTKSPEN